MRAIKTPVRAPRANAVAERWVRSVRNECLDRTLVFGRRHLQQILRAYLTHYNTERPHHSLALASPERKPREVRGSPPREVRAGTCLAG